VTTVGRLAKQKGLTEYLEVASALSTHSIEFTHIGSAIEPEYTGLAQAAGVTFTGHLPHGDALSRLRQQMSFYRPPTMRRLAWLSWRGWPLGPCLWRFLAGQSLNCTGTIAMVF